MISSILNGIKSLWNSRDSHLNSRKRPHQSEDYSSDDEGEAVMVRPDLSKKAKYDRENDVSSEQSSSSPLFASFVNLAHWIVPKRLRFADQFFISTRLPLQSSAEVASCSNSEFVNRATNDDDEGEMDASRLALKYVRPDPKTRVAAARHEGTNADAEYPLDPLVMSPSIAVNGGSGRSDGWWKGDLTRGKPVFSQAEQNGRPKQAENSVKRSQPPILATAPRRSVHDKVFGQCPRRESAAPMKQVTNSKRNLWATNTPMESVRLEERDQFSKLLQQFRRPGHQGDAGMVTSREQRNVFSDRGRSSKKEKGPVTVETLSVDYSRELRERLDPLGPVAANAVVWARRSSPDVEFVEAVPGRPRDRIEEIVDVTPVRPPAQKSVTPKQRVLLPDSSEVEEVCEVPVERPVSASSRRPAKPFDYMINRCVYVRDSWLKDLKTQYRVQDELKQKQIDAYGETVRKIAEQQEANLRNRVKQFLRFEEIQIVDEEEEEGVEALPVLTDKMLDRIEEALCPTPPGQVLSEAFNLRITRRDMETLGSINWLNDEVINFYFSMLMERGRSDNFPSVYTCNTFFYPKLMGGGHASLKRWTRRVDIFAHDYMLIPVHLDIHWCLAVVDFRNKKILYYDSMGGSNNACLQAVSKYLEAEHADKKKKPLDTSDWTLENVKDNPHQLNGSDCGMFTCKYAEYISRNAKIAFTQDDMPYFRKRMVYEILTKSLM